MSERNVNAGMDANRGADGYPIGAAGGIQETADTARLLAQTLERGAEALDRASHTAEAVTARADWVTQQAEHARDDLNSRVRQHPFVAAGAAFTVGFLIGRS